RSLAVPDRHSGAQSADRPACFPDRRFRHLIEGGREMQVLATGFDRLPFPIRKLRLQAATTACKLATRARSGPSTALEPAAAARRLGRLPPGAAKHSSRIPNDCPMLNPA